MDTTIIRGLVASAALAFGLTAHAVDITGAGATFPFPIYAKWADAYKQKTGVGMNYQSIGSGAGIKQIQARTVDFGATDAPLKGDDLQKLGLVQFPAIIGGVVPVLNLDGIKPGEMKLTGPVLADIYFGKIKKWNEKAISDLNPGVKLPDENITVVRRSDGSGTTFLWTDYLSKVSAEWKEKVGASTAVAWPEGVGGKGNEGVASYVQRIKGAIGYVEYAYAKRNKMAHVALRNKDGQFVQPDDDAFQAGRLVCGLEVAARLLSDPHRAARQDQLAHHGGELHPHSRQVGQAGEHGGSPQVLRLGPQERPEDGDGARLRAAARGCREADRRRMACASEGRGRQGALELMSLTVGNSPGPQGPGGV
jgi:phosphate transport system substrate-binding protein